MGKLFFLLFLFFLQVYPRYLKYNIAIVLTNTTVPNVLFFNSFNRGRFGISYVGISNSNSSLEGGLVLMSYISNYHQIVNRYIGGNTTDIQPILDPNNDNLWINCTDTNEYPIGEYVNGYYMACYFNNSLFIQKYSSTFWITAAFSYFETPYNATVFEWPLPSNTPPSWEKQTFQYSIEAAGVGLDLISSSPRWETFNLSIYIISLCFYVFMGILTVCFMGQQPLKSRGLTPLFACIGQFLVLLFEMPPFILTVHDLQWQCLYIYVFQRPIVLIIVLISLIHFIRYVIVINLNQKKVQFLKVTKEKENPDEKNNNNSEEVSTFVKFLKVIGHPAFTITFIIVAYFIFAFIFLIPFFSDTSSCTHLNETVNKILYAVILVGGFGISIFFIILFDVWVNFEKFQKCKLLEFWREDIFYLRFEIYLFGVFLCLGYFIIYGFVSEFVKMTTLADGILTSLAFHFLFLYQNIFSLKLTIIWTIKKCIKNKKTKKGLIETIMDHPEASQLFKKYLMDEFAIENYHSYKDIQKYQKEFDLVKRLQLGTYIYKLYMNGASSKLEVNIPNNVRKKIKDEVNECKPELYDEAMNCIIENLTDTFSRLMLTKEFIELNKKENFLEKNK